MKIAVITPDYPPQSIGGCAASSQLLVETLRQEHTVDVFVSNTAAEPLQEEKWTVAFFAGKPKWLLWNNVLLVKALWGRLKEYDVVHVYNVSPIVAIIKMRFLRRLNPKVRIVMTLNNPNGALLNRVTYLRHKFGEKVSLKDWVLNPEMPLGLVGSCIRFVEIFVIRWATRRADRYIALTEEMKTLYMAAGCDEKKFVVIPNMSSPLFDSTPSGQAQSDEESTVAESTIPIRIATIGQLSPLKGQLELLEAFFSLPSEVRSACRVEILGRGKDEALLNELIQTHKAEDQVIVRFTPYEELSAEFEQVDIVVLLSKYPEPFSRVWLEAMQHGVALLVTENDGAKEVLDGAALYCNPFSQESIAHTLQQLITDSTLRKQLQHVARERSLLYTPEQVQPLLLELYKTV